MPASHSRHARRLEYVALATIRLPLEVDGELMRCVDVTRAEAMTLVGLTARTDGLDVSDVPAP